MTIKEDTKQRKDVWMWRYICNRHICENCCIYNGESFGGACGVMVIVAGNGHGDTRTNSS